MLAAYHIAKILSMALFLYYGIAVLATNAMVAEFERFGLARFRRLTGVLEVLGALGLLAGYLLPRVDVLAAGGLTLLMLLGLATRIRVRDPLVEAIPALVLLAVNAFVFAVALGWMG